MRPLDALRRFIITKQDEGAHEDVRAHVNEYAGEIAEAFGITADMLRAGIEGVDDDARLARLLLVQVERARKEGREAKARERMGKAQEAADAIGATARHRESSAWEVDLPLLLSSVLAPGVDVVAFACDAFTTAMRAEPLRRFRQLKRRDAWAFVDADGFHVRWPTGGLNLRACAEPNATKLVVNLAPATACAA